MDGLASVFQQTEKHILLGLPLLFLLSDFLPHVLLELADDPLVFCLVVFGPLFVLLEAFGNLVGLLVEVVHENEGLVLPELLVNAETLFYLLETALNLALELPELVLPQRVVLFQLSFQLLEPHLNDLLDLLAPLLPALLVLQYQTLDLLSQHLHLFALQKTPVLHLLCLVGAVESNLVDLLLYQLHLLLVVLLQLRHEPHDVVQLLVRGLPQGTYVLHLEGVDLLGEPHDPVVFVHYKFPLSPNSQRENNNLYNQWR